MPKKKNTKKRTLAEQHVLSWPQKLTDSLKYAQNVGQQNVKVFT